MEGVEAKWPALISIEDHYLADYRWWQDHGEPRVERFGMTVRPEMQAIWLVSPEGKHRWKVG